MRFGIETWCRHRKVKYTGSDKQFDAWELVINKNKYIELFINKIGIFGKEEALQKCVKYSKISGADRTQKYIYENCPEAF